MGCFAKHATTLKDSDNMKLETTPIEGLYVLHRAVHQDSRGQFTRLFAAEQLAAAGRPTNAVHVNTSTSVLAGTLRGIHFQYPPFEEAKIVACTSGAIWDVGVDLRPESPTRFQWYGTVLTPENGVSMVIPEGFGHAFITIEPNSTAVYVVSTIYAPERESGIRYDDQILAIDWPIPPTVLSIKDLAWGKIETRINELNVGFSI
jgi:dTDP-4-dehydrorhamnose 3,5-epimerase